MIYSLLLDLDDSVDFPGNDGKALGRPLATYPIMAAKASRSSRTYAVTSSPPVKSAAAQYGALVIDPPSDTAEPSSHAEHLLRHGWRHLKDEAKDEGAIELVVVLFSNAPAVTAALIDEGLEALHNRPELDSAVSVSPRNRWNPFNARRIAASGLLEPYLEPAKNAGGEVWFPDWGVQILRPSCLEAQRGAGQPPFPWLGAKTLPLKQWGGGPVDYSWQIPAVEYWLKKHGYPDSGPGLEPQPKPQLAPKPDRR